MKYTLTATLSGTAEVPTKVSRVLPSHAQVSVRSSGTTASKLGQVHILTAKSLNAEDLPALLEVLDIDEVMYIEFKKEL